jgi:PAS domain S-box-containing protein
MCWRAGRACPDRGSVRSTPSSPGPVTRPRETAGAACSTAAGDALDRLARLAARALRVPTVVFVAGEARRPVLAGGSGIPETWGARRGAELPHPTLAGAALRGEAGTWGAVGPALPAGSAALASVPVRGRDGGVLGALCALDSRPRTWTPEEMEVLSDVADAAVRELGHRPPGSEGARAADARAHLMTAALEQLGEAVGITDTAGRFLYANAAHARTLGYPTGSHGEYVVDDFLADEPARARFRAAAEKAHEEGCWRGRISFRTCAGATVPMEVILGPVRDGVDEALLFSVSRDVSDEVARESQLRRAERLASLGTLVSGVAHELNNPLAAIKSFAQLLLLDERPLEDQEALEVIEREAARAAKIVADLRLAARQTERSGGAREPVQLNEVVRHVLALRGYTLQTHNVEVRDDLSRDLPLILADRGEVEQVVLNLVLNAEHSLADHPGERRLVVRTRPSGASVSLHVVDSGPGIPEEHLERIFDPFWTTKEPGKGTGLGLSLVHATVTEHGGTIQVDSEPGRGAAFVVEFPLAPRPAGAPGVPGRGRALRVLVVDDEAPIRRSLALYLERLGHRVEEAGDGREALDRIVAAPAPYDVVLADLRMPGLGGDRLLAELRARGSGADRRVVFITGDALSDATAAGYAAAGIPVVFKPFELEQVARAVELRAAGADVGGSG